MDTNKNTVRIAAVGDLLLAGAADGGSGRDGETIFSSVKAMLSECDVVFGNLECTLAGDGRTVATEPRVVSTGDLIRSIKQAGFNIVTLANNHMFDYLDSGFHRLKNLLDELGIKYFGAGDDLKAAAAPAIMETNGVRIAFLGSADERSGPSHFARADHWGVAPLDVDKLIDQIRRLRDDVDHVIVSPHWGEERFLIPSPQQIDIAHAFIDAGASMVIGHHPHVIQGMETYRDRPIIYSLGNFVANDVHFSDGDVMKWNRTERTGCILLAELDKNSVIDVKQLATFDTGQNIEIDRTTFGQKRIARTNRAVANGVTLKRYRREHLWVKTIKPILDHLRWSKLIRIRPRHLRNAIKSILNARKAK